MRGTPRLRRRPLARPPPAGPPGVRELLSETLPLAGSVACYGPPVIFLAGPWALLGLMLMGPFALPLTFAAAAVAAVTLLVGRPAS